MAKKKKKQSMKPKGILNGEIAAVNQLRPFYYEWAWQHYLDGCANHWMPTEISMQKDIEQWHSDTLTDDEKRVFTHCLGFFAGSESLVANNIIITISKWVTNPECRQYLGRQNWEEQLHNHTIVYICESLNLDEDEIYEAYVNIPSVKAKDDFFMQITSDLNRPDFNTKSVEGVQEFLRNLITYYIICEGIMFYSGFAMLLHFKNQGKMPGVGQQIEYTLRDESIHIKFGTELINTIAKEHPKAWTKAFQAEIEEYIKKAVELEIEYAKDVLPRGILGLNSDMFVDYVQYIANRRLEGIKLPYRYEKDKNPFPWLSETIDLKKVNNFFESRVTEYQMGQDLNFGDIDSDIDF